MAKRVRIEDRVETRTREIGKDLYERLTPRSPSIFHGRWWEDRLINWAMEDDAVRVQMLRFVDALPMLRDHSAIAGHLEDYFQEVKQHLPWAARIGLDLSTNNSILSRALAFNARTNSARIARRFISGETPAEAFKNIRQLRKNGFAFSLEQVESSIVSEAEADAYQQSYLDLIEEMSERVDDWPSNRILDQDGSGAIPRLHITVKLSALDSQFRAIDPVGSRKRVLARLRPIFRAAQENHVFVQFGMEKHKDRILALDICKRALMEKEFRGFADAGVTVQAYLHTAAADLKSLLTWVKKRATPITVRLEKGAFWDYETAISDYRNWPSAVCRQKWQSDESFELQCRFLMKNHEWLRPALASQNIRSLAHGLAWAEEHKVADHAFEVQMRYGTGEEPGQLFTERGYRVRLQAPYGSLIPGVARLARHLLENTSNDSFLRHSLTRPVALETQLMTPSDHAAKEPSVDEEAVPGFVNEPHTDFNVEENRSAMKQAIVDVKDEFGQTYPLVIDGKSSESRSTLSSRNPSNSKEIVGHVAAASADQSADAVDAAQRTFPQWAAMETSNRCEYVELIAAEIRERRFELTAWVCLEVGKTWEDADSEVAEAIDYCMYYASEMRRLDVPQTTDFKGEDNSYSYRPRGVAVVISPWNSPLAALTGMTAAAVVAGNTVVMKPAEQASVVAAKLMDVIRNAGVPDGVVNFLPGIGEDIGPELTGSPDVDLVCFTGSQEVGLEINRTASETDHRQASVRRVIAEMSGKNAIIVDEDADLDEAVPGVMHSAFGYAGQKCSACSRVIVLDGVHDKFVERLVEATKSLQVGAADDPATTVGPVIDDDAKKRIEKSLKSVDAEIGEEVALAVDVKKVAKDGSFVGPTIVTGIDAESNLGQEELLGPVLCVIKVRNLDDAFTAANATRFALTGGVYSRSPTTLKRARSEFHVGNLFLNREITGTVVQRQPFGGYRMSGIGSKAGGPDYLLQFLIPINVTENTARRGFDKKTAKANT